MVTKNRAERRAADEQDALLEVTPTPRTWKARARKNLTVCMTCHTPIYMKDEGVWVAYEIGTQKQHKCPWGQGSEGELP